MLLLWGEVLSWSSDSENLNLNALAYCSVLLCPDPTVAGEYPTKRLHKSLVHSTLNL